MTVLSRRRALAGLAALTGALGAAACTPTAPSATTPSSSGSATGGFPVTLAHALGTTTIPAKPQRIVTLNEDLDTLVAIGVAPVGYGPVAPGWTTNVPYHQGLVDLGAATVLTGDSIENLSMEQVASLAPDLILASNSFGLDKVYGALSRIAPTLGYEKGWGQTSWQDMSRTVGTAIGESAKVAAAIARSEQSVASLKAELPGLAGKTVASAFYHTAGTFACNPRSASMAKYLALGMQVDPKLLEHSARSTNNSISLENIDLLDADVLFLSFGSAALQTELTKSPIYQGLKAVRTKAVQISDPTNTLARFAGNNPTLLNVPWALEQSRPALEAGAAA